MPAIFHQLTRTTVTHYLVMVVLLSATSAIATTPANPCDQGAGKTGFWLDDAHAYLNTRFCEPALWFDSFFASERVDEENRPGSMVRWRNDIILTEGQGMDFKTRLNLSLQLPNTTKKLKLVFESDERNDLEDLAPSTNNEDANRIGLRYDFLQSVKNSFNIRISLSPSITLRYRHTEPLENEKLVRFTQEIFRDDSVNGARARIDFEETVYDIRALVRWTNEVTVAEDIDGAELVSALVFFQQLGKRRALSYEWSVSADTRPTTYATNYRMGLRYRKNVYRKWLFYELTPEITWPKDVDLMGNTILERRSVLAFIFRLEVHFENLK